MVLWRVLGALKQQVMRGTERRGLRSRAAGL